jgi:hypothetical protein
MIKEEQKEEKREASKELVKHKDKNLSGDIATALNIYNSGQRTEIEAYLKSIMNSPIAGFKTISEGLAIYNRAQDFNLPFTACVEHIHVINGKTGIDVHLIKTLLLRAGVLWHPIKDYAPLYEYTDSSNIYIENILPEYCVKCKTAEEAKAATTEDIIGVYPVRYYQDLQGNIYKNYQLNAKYKNVSNATEAMAFVKQANGQIPVIRIPNQPVDYITEYEFERHFIINGKDRVLKKTYSFTLSEAIKADLLVKDTYKKYTKTMVSHRAFTNGARDIADDLLFGCLETTELKIINNKPLNPRDFDNEISNIEIIEEEAQVG